MPITELRKLLTKADSGNKAAYEQLCTLIDTNTAGWSHLGDMAHQARQGMIHAATGGQALFSQDIFNRHCDRLTRELAGSDPTPLERLLVDRIVVCWLHVHIAERVYAQNAGEFSLTQATYHQHRISMAHSRYLSSIRTLAQVRRLQLPSVQVNIAREQLNVAAIVPPSS